MRSVTIPVVIIINTAENEEKDIESLKAQIEQWHFEGACMCG